MTAATRSIAPSDGDLWDALRAATRLPRLLVATAFDGTLAPIPDGAGAVVCPEPAALRLLQRLAAADRTAVAVISGRSLRDLALASRLPAEVTLVGSHGAETGPDYENAPASAALLDRLCEEARSIAAAVPGVRFERKPAGLALHLGGVEPAKARWVGDRVRGGLGVRRGVRVIEGAAAIELTVAERDKRAAVAGLRRELHADAVVYLGDDQPDEVVFEGLSAADVGIRVGGGRSAAAYRVPAVEDVVAVLETLAERRG